jgi:hypothetical protein
MNPVALITGARSPAALDLARDFSAAGMSVHMADSSPARIARWSRTPAAVHRLASPVHDRDGFRRGVAGLVERLQPAIVVPTCEEIFHLAAARADGVDVGPLFAPDLATLDCLHAKNRFNALALSLGLDAPATTLITGPLDTSAQALDGKVLKACYSRFGLATIIGPGPAAAAIRPTEALPWIVQTRIDGVEFSSYAVAVGGRVTAFAAYRSTLRLRGGAGYAFRPAPGQIHDRLFRASCALAEHLGITGQLALDAIDDGQRSWLIECNPRATSGVHLIAGDGCLARAMRGERSQPPVGAGGRHLLPMMLSWGVLDHLRHGRLPTFAGRDVIGAPGDRMPLLGAIADTIGFTVAAARHRVPLTGATTRDIEWNGERT